MSALSALATLPTETNRVLYVDDEPDLADLAATYLEREDDRLDVVTATRPQDALEMVADGEIDCVVSDYAMPGMDGIELLEAVREEYPELPFILVTGKGSEAVASDAISAGVTDYLRKQPGTEQYAVLAHRVNNAVEQYRSHRLASQCRRRLRSIVDLLPQILFVVDEEGKYVLANEALADFHGVPVEELEGAAVGDVHDEDVTAAFTERLQEVLEAGCARQCTELEITDPSGDLHVFEPHLVPYELDETDTRAVLGIAEDVTEKVRRERELQRHEAYLEESTDVITVLDEAGTIRYESPSVTRILGYQPGELIGRDGFEFVHPDDLDRVTETFADLVHGPAETATVECRFRTADDEWRWLEVHGSDELDTPPVEGVIANSRDITERRQRTQELQRVERRYEAIFHDPNILVGLIDTDGAVLEINETAMEYVDATREDVIQRDFWNTPWFDHSAEVQDDVRDWIERAASGEYVEFEADLVRPDGEPYTVQGVFRPVVDENGDVVSLVISDRDVTERKRRETRLRQYERAIEYSSEMIAAIDDDNRYLFANQAYRDYHDLDREALEDITLRENLEPEVFETIEPYLDRAFDGETTRHRTTRSRPDLPARVLEIQCSPLEHADGTVEGVVVTIRDITEQREREAQLVTLDRMLRHNLHNELNVVMGYADLIADSGGEEVTEYAESISASTGRILDQADKEREIVDVLTAEPRPHGLDLTDVVARIRSEAQERHPEADISLAAPDTLSVRTLPEIERAIEELVTNAIQHDEGDSPEVAITVERGETTVEISVRDSGPGMPSQEREVIAEDSPVDPLMHSSGMGLWLVKRIVTRAGGTLRIDEADGSAGSVVTIVLPETET